ncbi:hypothetical protein NEF87_003782 [Candidatus Lokiarchaeum ossiferum]|uniref:Uncharacterized protein n=1 Tax=Candidatus Lokiarchaeum ossiferum TaxID=2951803 RepID=A0ABY6HYV5_9ARCH|nr:hypothetical protein NEF87_003782 [Candidatus Lokiarchaeum sp. B-35]
MAKKASKSKKNIRTIACKHLESINAVSNAGNPLCYCSKREFTISPYNLVCQVCDIYKPNPQDISHAEMYVADDAGDFEYSIDDIEISDDDFESEPDIEEDEEFDDIPVKKKKTKKAAPVTEEDDDEDIEIEKVVEEEDDVGIVIGLEKEEEEEELDYVDEREEGLGKKHGTLGKDDDEEEEEEELDEELDDLDDEFDSANSSADDGDDDSDDEDDDYDFEEEVIAKIKTIGDKEICPFCQKSKVSVLRHITKCKRAPAEAIAAYAKYKTKKKKTTRKKKTTAKK